MTGQAFVNEKSSNFSQLLSSRTENRLFICVGINVYSNNGELSSVTFPRM